MASERRAFSFRTKPLYRSRSRGSPHGYGDKRRRLIGAADPGAVPGGSTTNRPFHGRVMTGPNQDRRVLKSAGFCSEWDHRDGPYTSANDNEALAIAA